MTLARAGGGWDATEQNASFSPQHTLSSNSTELHRQAGQTKDQSTAPPR